MGWSADSDKAIGAACRLSGRSLEECYRLNPDAGKASIWAGWRDMQEYMVKQNLSAMPSSSDTENTPTQDKSARVGASSPSYDPQVEAVLGNPPSNN